MASIMTAWAEISGKYTNWSVKSVLINLLFLDFQGIYIYIRSNYPVEKSVHHIALPFFYSILVRSILYERRGER